MHWKNKEKTNILEEQYILLSIFEVRDPNSFLHEIEA
jgi:hypothetical protein